MISRLSPESFSPFTTPMARWEATVLQTHTAPSGTLHALSTALPNHNYFAHISLQAFFFFSTFAPFLCVFHPQGGREPHPPTLLPPLGTSSHYHASPSTHSPHQPSARPPPSPASSPPRSARGLPLPLSSQRSDVFQARPSPRSEKWRRGEAVVAPAGGQAGGGRGELHTHGAAAAVLREAKGSRRSPVTAEPSAPLSAPPAGRGRLCPSPACRAPTLRVGYSCTFKVIES